MKEMSYVTSIRNLNIIDRISGYVELLPCVNITNDPAVKRKWVTHELTDFAGLIESAYLQSDESNLIFGELDFDGVGGSPPEAVLLAILSWMEGLFQSAWIIKEHAMTCDAAFLRAQTISGVTWTSNFLSGRPSFSDGYSAKERNVDMSIQDLKEWSQMDDLVNGYLHSKKSGPFRFMMEKGYCRSGRALRFVAAARHSLDIAFKISNYCSAFETLFTTDSTEVTHKLSERVAFFLSERGYDRHTVFSTIKSAYGVRSKLVHGDTLRSCQVGDLQTVSSRCDDYLRKILGEIFIYGELKNIFDSEGMIIEEYFYRLILGPS